VGQQQLPLIVRRRNFQPRIAFAPAMKVDLLERFVDRDLHQQFPDIIGFAEDKSTIASPAEERAKDRLHDVLGIEASGQCAVEPPLGHGQQPAHISIVKLSSGLFIAGLQAFDAGWFWRGVGHGQALSNASALLIWPMLSNWVCKELFPKSARPSIEFVIRQRFRLLGAPAPA
jgi:hypothetical protein